MCIVDYHKQALPIMISRCDFTENRFRLRFRRGKPEGGESPEQYITRLHRYLSKWIEMSNTESTFESDCELILSEECSRVQKI